MKMTKKEFKKAKLINLNHNEYIKLQDVKCGRTFFKIKLGYKIIYVIEIDKNISSAFIARKEFSGVNKNNSTIIFNDEKYITIDHNYNKDCISFGKDEILNLDKLQQIQVLKNRFKSISKYL